ncbi:hypothetical protein MASR2M64_14380 [Candidatus Cloacimonadota bacterium]
MKTQKHCEICGTAIDRGIYRYFGTIELIIYLNSPNVVRIDKVNKTVTISNGDRHSYTAIQGDEAYQISQASPHLVCSEECVDRFIDKESCKIVSLPDDNVYPCFAAASINAFLPVMFNPISIDHEEDLCEYCGDVYPSRNVDFTCIPLVDVVVKSGIYPAKESDIINGYHLILTDCNPKKLSGTFYISKLNMDKASWRKRKFCSNECAFKYCVRNDMTAQTYSNLLENRRVIIAPFTKSINVDLQNKYLFRPLKV